MRELLSTLTSKKKRRTTPKGWDPFMRSLRDTDAPADILYISGGGGIKVQKRGAGVH